MSLNLKKCQCMQILLQVYYLDGNECSALKVMYIGTRQRKVTQGHIPPTGAPAPPLPPDYLAKTTKEHFNTYVPFSTEFLFSYVARFTFSLLVHFSRASSIQLIKAKNLVYFMDCYGVKPLNGAVKDQHRLNQRVCATHLSSTCQNTKWECYFSSITLFERTDWNQNGQ